MPAPFDGKRLTNDAAGFQYEEVEFTNGTPGTSVHGFSNTFPLGVIPPGRSGYVVAFGLGVRTPAVSAAAFPAAANGVTGTLRINSAATLSTDPVLPIAGNASHAASGQWNTWAPTGGGALSSTSAVVNAASRTVAGGDTLYAVIDAKSVGSGAATAAGVGAVAWARVRLYSA